MKLTMNGIKERSAWEQAGIKLPGYDVEAVSKKAKEAPVWAHFGIGNIFRVFIGACHMAFCNLCGRFFCKKFKRCFCYFFKLFVII